MVALRRGPPSLAAFRLAKSAGSWAPDLARRLYDEQTGAIMFEISKRNFLIILVAVLIGVGITVEITYYVAQWYFAAQRADDPLSQAGGLKPAQAIDKK